jgi:hypothetical protein
MANQVQAWVDAAIGPGGIPLKEVTLPAGTIDVPDTINVTNVFGLVIRGAAGPIGTELRWVGEDERPMWVLNRTQWVSLENFSIRASPDKELLEGVRIQQGPDAVGPSSWPGLDSSHCTLDRIVFRGGGHLGTAVRVYVHGDDIKNDYHRFSNVQCSGFTYAAFKLEGRNAKAIILDRCLIQSLDGKYGIDTVRGGAPPMVPGPLPPPKGTFNSGAQVFCYGVNIVGVQCAVRIGDRNGNFSIEGGYSEKCGRLLLVPGYGTGSGGPCAISIKDFRFALGETTAGVPLVECHGGSLSIVDCTIGHFDEGPVTFQVDTQGSFRFEGNFVAGGAIFTDHTPDGAPSEWGKKNRVYKPGQGMEPLVP